MKTQPVIPKLILGSSSIYRQELLGRLKVPFEVSNPDVDEAPLDNESPDATAVRLAAEKTRAVARTHPGALIIGADQVATLDGVQLSKPLNRGNAIMQLRLVRGREVLFHSALSLLNDHTGNTQTQLVSSRVMFRQLTDQQIDNYLDREQPYHCAGSAKLEGLGIALIEQIASNDPSALIGLPLIALVGMLAQEGIAVV